MPSFNWFASFPAVALGACMAAAQPSASLEPLTLKSEFEAIRAEAVRLAGKPTDISQRVVFLHQIFLESYRLHAFPEVALHGALWAHQFFSRKNLATNLLLTARPDLSRNSWMKKIDLFSHSLLSANRQVFIDTYTNFYFTRRFGTHAEAEKFVPRRLLQLLNQIHALNSDPQLISGDVAKNLQGQTFEQSLKEEQEKTVGPLVAKAVEDLCPKHDPKCLIARKLMLMPVVRFGYFPEDQKSFYFQDFSNVEERIHYAVKSFEIASSVGWAGVESSLSNYAVNFPQEFRASPLEFARSLRAKILGKTTP